jgi:AhpD family alkylhydroperoxidase
MPRIPARDPSRAGLLIRLGYRAARRRFGQVPEPAAVMAHHPRLVLAYGVHEWLVEGAATRLPAQVRDLVQHRVATRVGCSWCVDFGTMLAIQAGFTVDRHRALAHYVESPLFDDDEKAALAYADAMTDLPMTVTDEMVAGLRERFGDAGVIELTYLVALENLRARANHALGITAQGYTAGDACPMPFDEQISRAARI